MFIERSSFYRLALGTEPKAVKLFESEFQNNDPRVSPDGQWIAFQIRRVRSSCGAITGRAPNRMTGSIKNLNPVNRSGFIKGEDGKAVYFAASAVWEHDYPFLTVGQAVSFDLLDGQRPMAINVHLYEGRHIQLQPKKPDGPVELRFVGFRYSIARNGCPSDCPTS
jgi:cold shock CspA family protein